MKVLDPGDVIKVAIDATVGLFPQAGNVILQTDVPESLQAVNVDADRLAQVLINLISNAAKFCDHTNGEVWITAKIEEAYLNVSVRDNGPGIAPRDHQKVFERFQQVGSQMKGKPKGTGLGLPICMEIIHHFDGELWVDSQLNKGATFAFRIPIAS